MSLVEPKKEETVTPERRLFERRADNVPPLILRRYAMAPCRFTGRIWRNTGISPSVRLCASTIQIS